jgi:hypothetical protein
MALIDVDGTAVGSATATGSLAVLYGLSESMSGSSSSSLGAQPVQHDFVETIVGSANVTGGTQGVFNMSGFAQGQGAAIDATVLDAEGFVFGGSSVTGNAVRVIGVQGFAFGGSLTALSVPEPIIGAAIVTANMEVIHVGYPICQTPQVNNRFRLGHQFAQGDLEICVLAPNGNPLGPVCITFTMYQVQRGCQPLQKGPSGRHPGKTSRVGCYYATGTAGECGQPGLWLIRWRYQGTFGGPWVEKDCYFYVLDSVLCPVPGDTLKRECKYGWD